MKFNKLILATAIGLSSIAVTAQAQQIPEAQKKQITEKIVSINPQVQIKSISKTAWDGVLEIVMAQNEIIYTNNDGTFVMATDGKDMMLLDVNNKKNLTAERIQDLNKIDYKKLDKNNAIVLQKGNGGEVSVFADPNCGFCKKYEKVLDENKNVTVNLYLYPVLGADSTKKAENLWCAKAADRAKIWKDWMLNGTPIPETAKCNTSVIDKNLAFGKSHGVEGTPTTFFTNGTRASGAISSTALMKKIYEISGK